MLLGLDLGTSSLKAVLLDPETCELVQEKAPLCTLQPAADCAEADPETWWQALVSVLAKLREKAPAEFAAIRAVGISTIFPALVPMDAAGRPLRNSLPYCDLRSVPQVNALAARLGPGEFERRTGNRLTPGTCTLRMPETASLGAALIGGLGAGIFKTPEAARTATEPLRTSDVAWPVSGWVETYRKNYETYVKLYPAFQVR